MTNKEQRSELLKKIAIAKYPEKYNDHVKWCEQRIWEDESDVTWIQWEIRIAHDVPYITYAIRFNPEQMDKAIAEIESGRVLEKLEGQEGTVL